MTARVMIVKNIGREGPGLLRDVLMQHRIEADVVEIDRGEAIPDVCNYGAVVVLGGPPSATDPSMHAQVQSVKKVIDEDIPFLGICLGHQVLAAAAGETVGRAQGKEVGFFDDSNQPYEVSLTEAGRKDSLFDGLPERFRVFQLHGDEVKPSSSLNVLATGKGSPVQAIRVGRRAYGLQMHVEVVPEMLAVWCAQDDDLRPLDATVLQQQYADISADYITIGRRLLTNFLTIADLTSQIDLTQTEPTNVR